MSIYRNATDTPTFADIANNLMENYGSTYEKLQPRDYEVRFTPHVAMIGVTACTIEGTQNMINYHGLCVTAMLVESTMTKNIWHTTSQNDQKSTTTLAHVGIGTVHAEDT